VFCRLKCCITNKIIDIKEAYKRYKWIYITMLICLCIGLITGIMRADCICDDYVTNNLIYCLKCGDFNIFSFYIKILLASTILLICCFLLSFNYYVYFLNFPLVILVSRYCFGYIFACCIAEGILSVILTIIFWIPLIIGVMIYYVRFFIYIYYLVFCCNERFCIPYSNYWCNSKKHLGKALLCTYLYVFIYSSIIVIIFSLIL
jgi:hypothetical protein